MRIDSQSINAKYLSEYTLDENTLTKLKQIELYIYKDIERSCNKRNIPFGVYFGSLLGTVRHKGFIPWDDDLDCVAYIDDIQKIISALNEDYPNKYSFFGVLAPQNIDPFNTLKISLNGTKYVELYAENYPFIRGVNIDVFPIVRCSKYKIIRHFEMKKQIFLIHCAVCGFQYKYKPNILMHDSKVKKYYKLRNFLGFFCYPFEKKARKSVQKYFYRHKNNDNYAISCVGLASNQNLQKEDLLFKTYKFENSFVQSFINYDKHLRYCYGDSYMELPPSCERERHYAYLIDIDSFWKENISK